MKPISTALQNLFATGEAVSCKLFQFNLASGGTVYYSGGDVDISWGGNTFLCGRGTGPLFEKSDNKAKAHYKVGLEVDTLVFDVIPGSSTVQGTSFDSAVRLGIFDGAECIYSRAYWSSNTPYADPLTPVGVIANVFVGRVAQANVGRSLCTFTISSHLELLNQNMPRNLYQGGCANTLYDGACTLNQANFATNGTVISGSTATSILAMLSQATNYFTQGMLTFTSGVNNGVSRAVQNYTQGSPSTITLCPPLGAAPSAGDTFTVYAGCDKQVATCGSKFNNLSHFRGFPFVPVNEAAL